MAKMSSSKYRFNWQQNNYFELFCDGPAFFPAMLDDIQNAKNYILLEMYLIEQGRVSHLFFKAFKAAAKRGVKVYLLFDGFGTRHISQSEIKELQTENINLCYYNPLKLSNIKLSLFRDHRKLLVVDGCCAYIGGTGLIDDFDKQQNPQDNWRENMLKIVGENVFQWQTLFVENWQKWSDEIIPIQTSISTTARQKGRVSITSGPNLLEIKRSFINQVRNSKNRIWICTPYFAPSRQLRKVLRKSAQRGIDIRLLIPGSISDSVIAKYLGQRHYARFLRVGVRLFEYQPRFIHAKIVLCDQWVSIGSCNLDRWNFQYNLDANQEVDDPDFAKNVTNMFLKDFSDSKEICLEQWKQRSMLNRIRIWYWSQIIRLLDIFLLRWKTLRLWKTIVHWKKRRRSNKKKQ